MVGIDQPNIIAGIMILGLYFDSKSEPGTTGVSTGISSLRLRGSGQTLCEHIPSVEERDAGRPFDVVHVHVFLHAGNTSCPLALDPSPRPFKVRSRLICWSVGNLPLVTFERSK